jgi:hypothetical protein
MILLVGVVSVSHGADNANFAGEFADKNYLHGKGVFQLSLERNGNDVSIFFTAVHNDGSGAAPDAEGDGKVTAKGTVDFKWRDSFNNSGTGTIKQSGNDVLISIKASHVADAGCLQFYGENIRLKPAGKK